MAFIRPGVALVTVVVTGALLAKYFSYSEDVRPLYEQWLSLAILAASAGVAAFIWLGRRP